MNKLSQNLNAPAYWFVGASFQGATQDQLPRFLAEGIWENGFKDKLLDEVRSMRPGDRIAIKSRSTRSRKDGLPFDNQGHKVSVMAIKAIGTITENQNDGRHIKVDWTRIEPAREWYFSIIWETLKRVTPGEWKSDALIAFTFQNQPQDIERFRNDPFWRKRFATPQAKQNVAKQNGITRPKGGVTGKVWEIADRLISQIGQATRRKHILKACLDAGINKNTAVTQYNHWRKFNGVKDGVRQNKNFTDEKSPVNEVAARDDDSDNAIKAATPGYSVDDILKDGCFLKHSEIEQQLDRLRDKKNLILQGPSGTGKTWLAKRLAFALIGQKNESKVRVVQFHPNLSYEDFVRGWRPTGKGKLSLADGVFMEAIEAATKAPTSKFVVVIEEINRGNPAQIFGELLTLLEASKRNPSEALELCYPDADGTRRPVYVPENLYVVGTMNIADRSLALVDLALRRRFAFLSLEPRFGDVWRKWVVKECGVDHVLASDIERRMAALNETITADTRLGKQFQIGHSYVTPNHRLETDGTQKWFQQVVETEIGPLLEEYWFDAPAEAQKARDELLAGW